MLTPQSQNVHKLPQKRISQWSPNRWTMVYFYVLCNKNILMKLVGYQQPILVSVSWRNSWWETFRFHVNCVHFLKLLSFMWGRHNRVRKTVFRFTCAVRWKLYG